MHYILVSRSSQIVSVERVWIWFHLPPRFHDYSPELRDFKMAVARTRAMVSESFDSFVAPVINKPVPNHLLETSKCIIKWRPLVKVIVKWIFVQISERYLTVDFTTNYLVLQRYMPKLVRTLFCKPNLLWFTLMDFKLVKKLPKPLWVSCLILMHLNVHVIHKQCKCKIKYNMAAVQVSLKYLISFMQTES